MRVLAWSRPLASLLAGLGWGTAVLAGDLEIRAAGAAPATVVLDNRVVGQTPLTIKDLKEGDVVLGFREAPLGATAFTQAVHIPATGAVVWEVDLPRRTAKALTTEAGSAALPAATPPPAAAPEAPREKGKTGDLYITSTPVGGALLVDGKPIDPVTPAMLRGLAPGAHHVEIRTPCTRASADVIVTPGVITRAELSPVAGTGSLQLNGTPAGALVFVDGKESGVLPVLAPELSCGDHQVAVRAPGFLETARTLTVPAFETTTVQFDLRKEEFGTLVVDVTPLETAIRIDGVDVGTGPRTLENVATGAHQVEGLLDGYRTASKEVLVEANQIARTTLALEKQKPAKAKKPKKVATGHPFPVGRVVVNSAVSVATVGAGFLAWNAYRNTSEAYDTYLATEDDKMSDQIYDEQVKPGAQRTVISGGLAAVGAVAAVVLWVKTDF